MIKQGKVGHGMAAISGFYKLWVIFRIKKLLNMKMSSRDGRDKCISIQCAVLLLSETFIFIVPRANNEKTCKRKIHL